MQKDSRNNKSRLRVVKARMEGALLGAGYLLFSVLVPRSAGKLPFWDRLIGVFSQDGSR
jgi:hypothetical protein